MDSISPVNFHSNDPSDFPPTLHLMLSTNPDTTSTMAPTERPTVGQRAPDFSAKAIIDGSIQTVNLLTYASDWLILLFIPMAWSFVCPTEVLAFASRLPSFRSRNAHIAFISTDSEYVLRAWNATALELGGLGRVAVPLLSDRSHRICRDYGVLVEDEGVAQRAVFIIDPKGHIRAICVNDAKVGRSVDEVQRLLDALEFADEFGEGCPVDWKKGDKGLQMSFAHCTPIAEVDSNAGGVGVGVGGGGNGNGGGTDYFDFGNKAASYAGGSTPGAMTPLAAVVKKTVLSRPQLATANTWTGNWNKSQAKARPTSWSPWGKTPTKEQNMELWNADAMAHNELAIDELVI